LDHEPSPFNALTEVTGQRYTIIIFIPIHGGHTIEILLASTARATQIPHLRLPILCTLGNTSFSTISRKRKDLSSVLNSSLIWTEDPIQLRLGTLVPEPVKHRTIVMTQVTQPTMH
jgi:hypothetical protein